MNLNWQKLAIKGLQWTKIGLILINCNDKLTSLLNVLMVAELLPFSITKSIGAYIDTSRSILSV